MNYLKQFYQKDSLAKDDIAVVRLREPVDFGPYVRNIEFNTDSDYPPDGTECFTQGWGCTTNGNLPDIANCNFRLGLYYKW